MAASDRIDLAGISNTFTGAAGTTIASATGTTVALVRGTFNSGTGVFTTGSTGPDTLFVYDADAVAGGNLEAIALIGTAGVTGTVTAGILTLA
jgi:hypothetical protein